MYGLGAFYMLEGIDIDKLYYDRKSGNKFCVLNKCNIVIGDNEIVGLMGSSGCGKSTLARVLLRLIDCDGGIVRFGGIDITKLSNSKLLTFRKNVQFVSQRPENFFDPMLKLRTSILEPLKIFGLNYRNEMIEDVLESVKLNIKILERYPHQISGGEVQRLSIARALFLQPKILILDEPTSMLDISVQAQVLHILKDIQKERNLSYLFISHDSEVINWISDRVIVMKNGNIVSV